MWSSKSEVYCKTSKLSTASFTCQISSSNAHETTLWLFYLCERPTWLKGHKVNPQPLCIVLEPIPHSWRPQAKDSGYSACNMASLAWVQLKHRNRQRSRWAERQQSLQEWSASGSWLPHLQKRGSGWTHQSGNVINRHKSETTGWIWGLTCSCDAVETHEGVETGGCATQDALKAKWWKTASSKRALHLSEESRSSLNTTCI